jgi:hypothetical protein
MTNDHARAFEEDRGLADDLAELIALSSAIETCADVLIGVSDPETARRALPVLTRMQQAQINRVLDQVERAGQ